MNQVLKTVDTAEGLRTNLVEPINFKRLQAKLLVVTGVWTLERVDEG